MKTVWKVLLGLALVVPMGAYVVGSLAASATDDPAPRHTIQISEPAATRTAEPKPKPTTTPASTPSATESAEVEVITPYDDLGDDHGGDRHGGRSGDDSGHGGSSGHGGRGED
jgi:hypothetical protein